LIQLLKLKVQGLRCCSSSFFAIFFCSGVDVGWIEVDKRS